MSKILITGAAGYIGSQIVHTLHRTFAQPKMVGVDNLSTGHTCPLPRDFECFHGDVASRRFMGNLITREKVTQIIHCAANISVPESVVHPLRYYHNNTAATLALIETARDCGVRTFVFSSTAAVYGEPEFRVRMMEDTPPRPINPYGKSKLMCEEFLRDSVHEHKMNVAILRYFNVAGADPLGQTGPAPGGKHLIAQACRAARGMTRMTRQGAPPLLIYGSGNAVRDYVHVEDVAAAHLAALDVTGCETFNIGMGMGASVHDVLRTVELVAGKDVPRKLAPERAGDPMFLVSNPDKARKVLGWEPRHTLFNMVEDTLKWMDNGQ